MLAKAFQDVPETWKDLFEMLAALVSWIPGMQEALFDFFTDSSSGWAAAGKALFLLMPILLWLSAVWCTQLLLYTLPFRSGRLSVSSTMLLAWWDAARMIWLYWVGLVRLAGVTVGWVFMLVRLGVKLLAEAVRQIVMMPFTMTRSEEHTSELQSLAYLVCRLLLEKKKKKDKTTQDIDKPTRMI